MYAAGVVVHVLFSSVICFGVWEGDVLMSCMTVVVRMYDRIPSLAYNAGTENISTNQADVLLPPSAVRCSASRMKGGLDPIFY